MIELKEKEKIRICGEEYIVLGGVFFHCYTEYHVVRISDQKKFWLELASRWILWEEMEASVDITPFIVKVRENADCLNFQCNGLTVKEQTIALIERMFGDTQGSELSEVTHCLEGLINGTARNFAVEIYDLGMDEEEVVYSEGTEVDVIFLGS